MLFCLLYLCWVAFTRMFDKWSRIVPHNAETRSLKEIRCKSSEKIIEQFFIFIFMSKGPFLESPENFLGPKSHLWNCQADFLTWFQGNKKKNKCEVWRLKSSPFLRYKGNCDTRKWPGKFQDFRETGPRTLKTPFWLTAVFAYVASYTISLFETSPMPSPHIAGEFRPDHNTRNSVPHSYRIVCGIFNVPQSVYEQGFWEGGHAL